MKELVGEAITNLVRKILERTNVLKERANILSDKLGDTPEGRLLKELKVSELSGLEIIGFPEASVIAMTDWYYCNKLRGVKEKDIFERIIMIRKSFGSEEVVTKLDQVLVKQPQSLTEFVRKVVEIEHDTPLSPEEIECLISEYKKIRKIE